MCSLTSGGKDVKTSSRRDSTAKRRAEESCFRPRETSSCGRVSWG